MLIEPPESANTPPVPETLQIMGTNNKDVQTSIRQVL